MGLFADLRKRRLVQIVVSYLAAGWIGLEVLSQLTQHGIVPELVYELGLLWFLAGIPAAFLVGWHHGEKGRQRAPLSEIVILGLVVVLAGSLSGVQVVDEVSRRSRVEAARKSALNLDRVAVLYFEDLSAGQELQHLADALTEGLIREFAEVPGLEVVSRNGVAPYRGLDAAPDSIAGALQAGTLVEGDIRRVGDRLRVNVALLDGQTGAAYGRRASFERPAEDFYAVQDGLVEEVSRLLREQMGGEVSMRRARRETTPAALVHYQRAEKARKDAEAALRDHEADAAFALYDRADSLLDQVELLDPAWAAPLVLRAELDYRRARLAHDGHDRIAAIDEGLGDAARALEVEPTSAPALGIRGILRYYRYLQDLIPDPDEAEALRQAARADLEQAVKQDPAQAGVWSALQHLYYTAESATAAVIAGERAYAADAYLEAADVILWRLYTGQYDLENFTDARRWCEEGARRFPANDRFVRCQLELLHTRAVEPDADRAWRLAARIDSLAPEHAREYAVVEAEIFVAGALARADLPDSARAVLRRAHDRITHEIDPGFELLTFEAAVWSMLGEDDHAIDLLTRHRAANPDASFEHHWWYRSIRSHPRYQEIAPVEHH